MRRVRGFMRKLLSRKPDVEFFTRLSASECQSRISEAVEHKYWFWDFRPDKPVMGWRWGNRFFLYKRIYYRNSFIPVFYGKLSPTPHGTYVSGSFRMHPLVILFFVIWFGLVGYIFGTGIVSALGAPADSSRWLGLLLPAGMLLFAMLMSWFGAWFARSSKDFVRDFLYRTLASTQVPPTPPVRVGIAVNWKYVLMTSLVGTLFLLPKVAYATLKLLSDAQATPAGREFFQWLTTLIEPFYLLLSGILLLIYVPALVGFLFAYLSTRQTRLIHPLSASLGGLIASSLLGVMTGLVDFGPEALRLTQFGIKTVTDWLLYAMGQAVFEVIVFAVAGAVGGQLGWLVFAKKEVA